MDNKTPETNDDQHNIDQHVTPSSADRAFGPDTASPVSGQQDAHVSPTSGGKKKWPWIGGIIVLILIIAGVVFAVMPRHTTTSKQSSMATTQPSPKPVAITGQPVDCGGNIFMCIPKVDINRDVIPHLKAAGFTCAPSGSNVQDCNNATTDQKVTFTNPNNDTTNVNISEIMLTGNAEAIGVNPADHSQDAWNSNTDNFKKTVAIVFAAYPNVQKDLDAWVTKQTGACNYPKISDHDTVQGYEVNCEQATPIAVSGSAGTVTTWTSIINLDAPLLQ